MTQVISVWDSVTGRDVPLELEVKVNGDSRILNPQAAKSLLNSIHSLPKIPVNGKVKLTVAVEIPQSSDALQDQENKKPVITGPTKT